MEAVGVDLLLAHLLHVGPVVVVHDTCRGGAVVALMQVRTMSGEGQTTSNCESTPFPATVA
jgi:hypothetical protein